MYVFTLPPGMEASKEPGQKRSMHTCKNNPVQSMGSFKDLWKDTAAHLQQHGISKTQVLNLRSLEVCMWSPSCLPVPLTHLHRYVCTYIRYLYRPVFQRLG